MPELNQDNRLRRSTLNQLERWLEKPMIWLSFLWLALLIVEVAWGTGPAFNFLGIAIWVVFIAEFALRLTLAPEKRRFLRSNWLTGLALAVPALRMFTALRFLRLARAARSLQLVRVVGSANRGMNALRKSMRRRGVGYVIALTILITLLGAAGIMSSESTPEGTRNLTSYGEALWWTAMLMTTLGTDFWPRTPEGRILCLLLAIYSFAVWGYITASIATFFIGQEKSETNPPLGRAELTSLRSEMQALREAVEISLKRGQS